MRGHFCKRGGKWSYTISAGTDQATGKRKRITKSGFATKRDCQIEASMLSEKLDYEKDRLKQGG